MLGGRLGGIDPVEFAFFAAQWEGMALDEHMADGGRYRRRRHAAFTFEGDEIFREPDQPHYQSTTYNALNGGTDRWFEPASEELTGHPLTRQIISFCTRIFSALESGVAPPNWSGELHQFRIEARKGTPGLPTPEGMHRDGVDWVLVLLVDRLNVKAGSTRIVDEAGRTDEFILRDVGEAVLLDDRRIRHGVTAITAVDPGQPAHRDVLVITWKAGAPSRNEPRFRPSASDPLVGAD